MNKALVIGIRYKYGRFSGMSSSGGMSRVRRFLHIVYDISKEISYESCYKLPFHMSGYYDQCMDCARGHAFLSVQDPDTREWASRLIGTRKVLRMGSSTGGRGVDNGDRSSSEDRERVFEPEAFGLLPDDDTAVIYMNGHYVKGKKTPYYRD